MSDSRSGSNSRAANNAKNTIRLGYWTLAWVVMTAIASFGPRFIWDFATVPTALAVLATLLLGFGMILSNRRYLRALDEMQQKIFLDAGAVTLGVGLVCGLGYELMETTRLISVEPKISHLVVLMSLTFLVSLVSGHRRYQ